MRLIHQLAKAVAALLFAVLAGMLFTRRVQPHIGRFRLAAGTNLTGKCGHASLVVEQPARALLQPPSEADGPVQLMGNCGLDLDAEQVPTLAVIGPSRRGKSVLCSLLSGGSPHRFKQSHSSFRAMTSGTHICEVQSCEGPWRGQQLRVIDTEGLSHIGRSRNAEALVRQFLVSTYLTSSWLIWLDTEVLSSSFFNMMWLVHDYVVDVLRVRDVASTRLPRLMYVRTQETDVQRREYASEFGDYGAFFAHVMEEHEDAHILRQMFAPGGIHGHALPVWTVEDLDKYEAGQFWSTGHDSPFKRTVHDLNQVLASASTPLEGEAVSAIGPPLMALSALQQHLPRISRLEAFDPRDHEYAKILRLRTHLRGTYGKGKPGETELSRAVWLADLFDPGEREVMKHGGDIAKVAKARVEAHCNFLRLDGEVGFADPEVAHFFDQMAVAANIFRAASSAFAKEQFSELGILRGAIQQWRLNPDLVATELALSLKAAEAQFLSKTGLQPEHLKGLGMHTRLRWTIDESIARLRARASGKLRLDGKAWGTSEQVTATVWYLGEWKGANPQDGKASRARGHNLALWTDGLDWALYTERQDSKRGAFGVLREKGRLDADDVGRVSSVGILPCPPVAHTTATAP